MKKKMIPIIYVISLSLFTLLFALILVNQNSKKLNDVSVYADCIDYDYLELKESADVIALVEVLDDLNEENSTALYLSNNNQLPIYDFFATRSVRVINYYKSYEGLNDNKELTIIEPASMINNTYLHYEGYDTLKKGEQYIVFLNDENESRQLSIISANNGQFSLKEIMKKNMDNEFFDIAVKFLVDFESSISDEQKEIILANDIVRTLNVRNALEVNTNYGTFIFELRGINNP